MHLSVIESLDDLPNPPGVITAAAWNALVGEDNPFLRYEFLSALERTACVGAASGWQPRHLVAHADGPLTGELLGAVPLYLKHHSYGEYVFDWAWANAYARSGLEYYPKLVAAVPFTPVTGPRLLCVGADSDDIATRLIQGALTLAQETGASSLHWLFTNEKDTKRLEGHGLMQRTACQFHWSNPGYRDFDEFLSGFTSSKRKKIKRERRHVREAGIEMEVLTNEDITPAHMDRFHAFYRSTIEAHGAIPYLSRDFFHALGETMSENIVLILARHGKEPVAGALNLRGRDTLYGRYWGCLKDFHSLHFETCYYAAIEYCIAQKLSRFEAGAQGEHKIARGFMPTVTYSMHWLAQPQFARAVADFLEHEKNGVQYYMDELHERTPFKEQNTAFIERE
jgi:uncharacterized protein